MGVLFFIAIAALALVAIHHLLKPVSTTVKSSVEQEDSPVNTVFPIVAPVTEVNPTKPAKVTKPRAAKVSTEKSKKTQVKLVAEEKLPVTKPKKTAAAKKSTTTKKPKESK